MFFCEFCEISTNTFFIEQLWTVAPSFLSSTFFREKNTGIENIFKTRKKSTKSHIDSCYYAILLERSVHSEAATRSLL